MKRLILTLLVSVVLASAGGIAFSEERIPLSGDLAKQIESITAAFLDIGDTANFARQNKFSAGVDLYSLPPLATLDILSSSLPKIHGMPSLSYVSGNLLSDSQTSIFLAGRFGFSKFKGIVVDNFSYEQGLIGADLILVHRMKTESLLFLTIGGHQTKAKIHGNFLIEDERSQIDLNAKAPIARLGFKVIEPLPLQLNIAFYAPESVTELRLGPEGSLLYAPDETPWSLGMQQLSLLWSGPLGSIGLGYIYDQRHTSFYRMSIHTELF